MKLISPIEIDRFVQKLLNKINYEFDPEIIPVAIEPYAKIRNCFQNVDEKIKREGGNVHYGWVIFKSDILCEAERHAVWENADGDLVDITPRELEFKQIMFVSDNDFVYKSQLVDNIRVNITDNPIVDDFIFVCENLEQLYTYGQRINDEQLNIPAPVAKPISEYENMKSAYLAYINLGRRPNSKCICGGQKNYKNCHGQTLRENIRNDMFEIKNKMKLFKY